MTKDDLNDLVTTGDLESFCQRIVAKVEEIVDMGNRKEFYTPRQFSDITGIKYSTVILYCNSGKLQATQVKNKGSWIIYRSEVDSLISKAKENIRY